MRARMTWIVPAVAACAVLAFGVVGRWGDAPAPVGPGAERGAGSEAEPTLHGRPVAEEAEAAPAGPDDIPLAEGVPPRFGVLCRVRGLGLGGPPATAVRVRLRMEAPEPLPHRAAEAVSDANGEARLGPIPVTSVPRRLAGAAHWVVEVAEEAARPSGRFVRPAPRIGGAELLGALAPGSAVALDSSSTPEVRWFHVDLWVGAGIPVEGRVTTAAGVGIPGVWLQPPEGGELRAETGDHGEFRFHVERPGAVAVGLVLATWGDRKPLRTVELTVPPEGLSDLRWLLLDVGEVSGRALEADGRPAAGAEVCLTRAGESVVDAVVNLLSSSMSPSPAYHMRARAGEDGAFRFVGTLPGRTYDVRWWPSDGEEDRAGATEVASGTQGLEIRLERHGVSPRLVDVRDGRPVHGAVRARVGEEERDTSLRGWFEPDQEGFLAPPGTRVTLLARARGYADAVVEHTVSDASGLDPVTVTMRPAASSPRVRVRCVDERGEALPWPLVRWTHEGSGVGASPAGSVEDGAFVTTDLGPGDWRLETWDGGGMSASGATVGLPGSGPLRFVPRGETRVRVPEAGDAEASWVLRSGGALRLLMRSPDGRVLDAGDMRSVRARDARGREVLLRLFRPRGAGWEEGTGAGGPYETQALPLGDWEVVWYDRAEGGTPLAVVPVVVSRDRVTDVDLVAR